MGGAENDVTLEDFKNEARAQFTIVLRPDWGPAKGAASIGLRISKRLDGTSIPGAAQPIELPQSAAPRPAAAPQPAAAAQSNSYDKVDDEVVRAIMKSEGTTLDYTQKDGKNHVPEIYGFRQDKQPEAYKAVHDAFVAGGMEKALPVARKYIDQNAHDAGADQLLDPGARAAITSVTHMRGTGGAHAILNAMAQNTTKTVKSAPLDDQALSTLNGLAPAEFQKRLSEVRYEYDKDHYGQKPGWAANLPGLKNRYDREQTEFLKMSPNPNEPPPKPAANANK
jgi:type VI secretion system secreted protein VgrG